MKYPLIILVFLSFINVSLVSQELEQVITPKPVRESARDTFVISEDSILESIEKKTARIPSSIPEEPSEQRDPSTYRKEEYLNKLLRHTYYQRILTPAWSKYLNPPSWQENVKKWRYWAQLKNYIAGNDEEILVIRKKVAPKKIDTIQYTSTTFPVDSSLLEKDDFTTPIEEKEIAGTKIKETSDESEKVTVVEVEEISPVKANPEKSKTETAESKVLQTDDRTKDLNTTPITETALVKEKPKSDISSRAQTVKAPTTKPIAEEYKGRTSNLSFDQKRGKMDWPVSKGKITDSFGFRKNAEARGLRAENYGIDMLCPAGSIVSAVHAGTVLMAKRQSPYDYIVTVKHKQYTTAYYYLINPYVKPGDQVLEGQSIGQLRTSVEEADFHFEIWDNQERINPELWLKKR